jgi:hypothetical protein
MDTPTQEDAMTNTNRSSLTILTVAALTLGSGFAQSELKPDQQYQGGTRVQASNLGVSFVIPKGWLARYGQQDGTAVVILGSNSIEGVGLAILVGNQTAQQVTTLLNDAQDLGGGVVLELAGAVKQQGNRVTARYLNAEYVGRALGLIGSGKNHVVYFFAGPQKHEKTYAGLLEEMANGTKFVAPVAAKPQVVKPQPAAPVATGLARQWTQFLSGMMLRYLSSYNSGGGAGGISTDRTLHFCSDGSFAYLDASLTTINVPGASASSGGNDRQVGRWRVESATQNSAVIVLSIQGGTEERIRVEYDGEKTFVNGQRWFRVESDACR